MSKIEKTLELNITHEILSLADSFWWYLQPTSLKRFWRPNWRFPLIESPKSFATGLHINLEGKTGGGYDVCINSPGNFQGGNPRLLFLQFKAGVEKEFNSNAKSDFYGDPATPNVHVEFEINHNAKHDQHRLLRDLATNCGNKDAVAYVLPRIVNEIQLQQNVGKLLQKTSFFTIAEIDAKAKAGGITIDDGNAHKFRTCYNDFDKNEINFILYLLGKFQRPGGILGEICAIRMFRALQTLKKAQVSQYRISRLHVMDAMIRHILNIGLHFSAPFDVIRAYFRQFNEVQERFFRLEEDEDLVTGYYTETSSSSSVLDIFNDILNALSLYFNWIEQIRYLDEGDIPQPPSDYTIEVNKNGLRFQIELSGSDRETLEQDMEEITFSYF